MNAREFIQYVYQSGYKNKDILRNQILLILEKTEEDKNKMEKMQRKICDRLRIPFLSPQRKVIIERFYHTLRDHNKQKNQNNHDLKAFLKIAKELEWGIYQSMIGITACQDPEIKKKREKNYRERFQKLHANMKDPNNGELIENILSKQISTSKFVSMSNYELASPVVKEIRTEAKKKLLVKLISKMEKEDAIESLQSCPQCESKNTLCLGQFQTRSADEPMTEFHTCIHCGHNWTIG